MPAADARTVATNTAIAQLMSLCCSGKSWPSGFSILRGGRKRLKHLAMQCLWFAQLGLHSSHVVEQSG